MSKHRSTQDNVSDHPLNRNFDPGTALENLRADVVDIEALARAAEAAADALPAPANDRKRILFGRIQSLTTKTCEQASASLRFANAQVSALTAYLEARRKGRSRLTLRPGANPSSADWRTAGVTTTLLLSGSETQQRPGEHPPEVLG